MENEIDLLEVFLLVLEAYEASPNAAVAICVGVGGWSESGGRIIYQHQKGQPGEMSNWARGLRFEVLCRGRNSDFAKLCIRHGIEPQDVWSEIYERR